MQTLLLQTDLGMVTSLADHSSKQEKHTKTIQLHLPILTTTAYDYVLVQTVGLPCTWDTLALHSAEATPSFVHYRRVFYQSVFSLLFPIAAALSLSYCLLPKVILCQLRREVGCHIA